MYGFPSSHLPRYRRAQGDDSTWYLEEKEIALADIVQQPLEIPRDYALHSHWLAIRGKVPNIPENQAGDVDLEPEVIEEEQEVVTNVKHQLSYEQQLYYNTLLKTLDTGNKLQESLQALNSDSSLTQLVPYLARSFYTTLIEEASLKKLDRGIRMLGALALNPHINLEPYLHQIMPTLLSGLLRKNLHEEGHWKFRENTSLIVGRVCEKYSECYEDLKPRVLKFYVSTLRNSSLPPTSHYGALKGVSAFGTLSTKEILTPLLESYMSTLEKGLRTQEVQNWNMVKAALIVSAK